MITSSQVTDIVYILSEGGNRSLLPSALDRLRGLRTFVTVHAVADQDIDPMLVSSWKDPEDTLIFHVALGMKGDAIVTQNRKDFETAAIKVVDCDDFFAWMKDEFGLVYEEIGI